jgi:spore germination cell wall hydrolase CwlJ-like protein
MAYARAPSPIEEPFKAVLGLRSAVIDEPNDGLYRPRPRPGDDVLANWLGGRVPAQFAPGLHDWLQNPLPASVYSESEQKCLAEGIYFEARGESESGQAAVAQVILNRVRNPAYPNTICEVVYQNETQRHKCQFSFACDGRAEIVRSKRSWKTAVRIARDVTDGKSWIEEVGDSTHYHANYVRPRWGRLMIQVDKIGAHIFYRTKFGGWS